MKAFHRQTYEYCNCVHSCLLFNYYFPLQSWPVEQAVKLVAASAKRETRGAIPGRQAFFLHASPGYTVCSVGRSSLTCEDTGPRGNVAPLPKHISLSCLSGRSSDVKLCWVVSEQNTESHWLHEQYRPMRLQQTRAVPPYRSPGWCHLEAYWPIRVHQYAIAENWNVF